MDNESRMAYKKVLSFAIICTCLVMIFITLAPDTFSSAKKANISTNPSATPKVSELIVTRQDKSKAIITTIPEGPESTPVKEENYIVSCNKDFFDDIYHKDTKERISNFHNYLEKSNPPKDKLAFILLANNTQQTSALDLLHSYLIEHPNNRLASIELIGHCSQNIEHSACNQELFVQAGKVDGNNAALWFQIANFHAASGDKQATLNAINKANKASQFDDYYYQRLSLFMNVSKGTLDLSEPLKAIIGIGILAATPIRITAITKFCTAIDNLTVEEKQACLMLGEQLDKRGKSLLYNAIGIAIQTTIYQSEQNDELSAQVEARKSDFYNPEKIKLHNSAGDLMIADEKLFQYWLSNAVNYGEVKAANLLIKEAISLSKNPDYNPCANE